MDQTVIVTGASTGIGRAIGTLLTQRGYRVFGTSRTPERAQMHCRFPLLPLDVQSAGSIQRCIQAVLDESGRIDVLINNAGLIGPAAACEEADLQQIRALFETNFFGVVQMTNAVLPIMRQQGGGKIINISSVCGRICAPPYFTFYAAAKHALEGYSEGLRYEVRPFNIQVAMVEPGYTSTSIGDGIDNPPQPIDAYANRREPLVLLDLAGIRYGTPPEATARTVLRIIRAPHPPLRSTVGTDGAAVLILRQWLPYSLFERFIEWMFFSWRPPRKGTEIPTPNELGLHRFLFHRPTRDRSLRAAALASGAILAIGALKILGRVKPG